MSSFQRRRDPADEERKARRRQREKDAARLADLAPHLGSMTVEVSHLRDDGTLDQPRYTQRVVVSHAAARFEFPCMGRGCTDGGYDLTSDVLGAVSSRESSLTRTMRCRGTCKTVGCAHSLRLVMAATYAAPEGAVSAMA